MLSITLISLSDCIKFAVPLLALHKPKFLVLGTVFAVFLRFYIFLQR